MTYLAQGMKYGLKNPVSAKEENSSYPTRHLNFHRSKRTNIFAFKRSDKTSLRGSKKKLIRTTGILLVLMILISLS